MKRAYLLSAATLVVAMAMASCGGSEETTAPVTYTLDADGTSLKWKGDYADGSHSHDGTVAVTEGTVVYEGDVFKSGAFKVDLNTVDSELDAAGGEAGLLEHFSKEDFFNSAKFPLVDVTITALTETEATATMKIGGKNFETTFPVKTKKTADKLTIKGKFDIDFTSLNLKGFQKDEAMEAEAAKAGKKDQYVSPIVHFDLDAVLKAPEAKK